MYYPLSQIITNLHTNGNEFMLSSTKSPYVGYYWKNSKGEYFTGRTPQDVPTNQLIIYNNNKNIIQNNTDNTLYYNQDYDSVNYLNLIKSNILLSKLPTYSPNIPTKQDYKIGEYRRYFCKKCNELIYTEIDIDTYNKLVEQNPQIQYQYYIPFYIPWQLTGDKTKVYNTNKNITELNMKQKNMPQFDSYLQKDYTKYYI